MLEIKNALLSKGFTEKSAEFFENTIHENFKEKALDRLYIFDDKEFVASLEDFALSITRTHEIYQGRKTTYLIQKIFFDQLLAEVEKIDTDNEYFPFYSPVVVSKVDGTVIFD